MPKVITKEAIKKFRKSKEMTPQQFAKFMGVTVHSVRSWEEVNRPTNVPKRLLVDPRTAHLAEEVN